MQGKDDQLTVIHGPDGQGRGRILRSFLAPSAIHQKPFTIQNIVANRNSPGFRPKPIKESGSLTHMTAVEFERARNGCPTVHDAYHKRGEYRLEGSMEIVSV